MLVLVQVQSPHLAKAAAEITSEIHLGKSFHRKIPYEILTYTSNYKPQLQLH